MSQKPRKLAEVQSEYAETIRGICLACGRPTANYYGMWQEGGTCCKKCEAVQEAKPKYPPPKTDEQRLIEDDSLDCDH